MNRLHTLSAALLLAATPLFAQTMGVSHPDDAPITTDSAPAPVSHAKPSAAVMPSATVTPSATAEPVETAAMTSLDVPAVHQPLPDPDADIVTYVPSRENELPLGTLIKVRMNQTVNTKNTLPGTPFTAYLSEPVERDGKVIIPAGAELQGTVEDVHGGARFFGRASLRLQPNQILLPDGSHYIVNAQVIDTDQFKSTQIGNDGAIIHSDHAKMAGAIFTLVTGASAATGAIFGGAPGALIGAAAGASISSVHWLRHDSETHLPVESRVVFSLTTPMPMTPLH